MLPASSPGSSLIIEELGVDGGILPWVKNSPSGRLIMGQIFPCGELRWGEMQTGTPRYLNKF